jgi:hypothetical protein
MSHTTDAEIDRRNKENAEAATGECPFCRGCGNIIIGDYWRNGEHVDLIEDCQKCGGTGETNETQGD